jgi:HEAT repeat protein
MTSRPLSLVSFLPTASGLLLLLAAGCTNPGTVSGPAAPTAPATSPVAKAVGAFDDDAHQPTAIEQAVVTAGKDPSKLAALERDLLATMQKPGSAPALVQEAAQHLGFVMQAGPSAATLAALAPMLSDPARVDYARLALDRVPGESVDALYLAALPKATGRVRLALIESAATRGLTAAVPQLASGLNDTDTAVAADCARALGRIGGPAALAALESAKDPLSPAVCNARLAAAAKIDAVTVARVADGIYRNPAVALPQRSAALRQLIDADPSRAVEEIHSALAGGEPSFQAVAIHAVSTLAVPGAAANLANRLGSYAPVVQVSLMAALGTRGDAGAAPGLLKALEGTDAGVRMAALEALGRLPGSTDLAQRLALLAAGSGTEAKAAFASLARLNGPGLDEYIRAGAVSDSNPALQIVFVQQLAARNQTEAIPTLLGLRASPVEALRLEALDALRAIASSQDQQALINWAVGTPSPAEQTRAVRALITNILRDSAVATRANTVITAINAGDAPARLVLLPVLSRVGGAAALACAGALAVDTNEAVATAATTELSRWPDATALPLLVDLAAGTQVESVRTVAVQGAARFLTRSPGQLPAERSARARKLIGLPVALPEKLALLNVLSLCSDQPALDAARGFLTDPATAEAARDAVDAITSNLAGAPVVTTSATPDNAALMADGKADTSWQAPNEAGTWIRADLHSTRPVRKITLEHGGGGWGYPGKFEVQVSDNLDQPGEVVVQAEGERRQSSVTLPAGIRGRYVWLRLAAKRDPPLVIAELTVE